MSAPVYVIVNAGSGSVLGHETAQSLRERFIAFGIKAEVHIAESGKDIVQLAREAAESEANLIVAGGGDGTISTVAIEASAAGKTLGILPPGTLNNFSKDLGIPQNLNAAVRVIAEGEVHQIDLAQVNGRISLISKVESKGER